MIKIIIKWKIYVKRSAINFWWMLRYNINKFVLTVNILCIIVYIYIYITYLIVMLEYFEITGCIKTQCDNSGIIL